MAVQNESENLSEQNKFEGMYEPDLSCFLCLDKTQKETDHFMKR